MRQSVPPRASILGLGAQLVLSGNALIELQGNFVSVAYEIRVMRTYIAGRSD